MSSVRKIQDVLGILISSRQLNTDSLINLSSTKSKIREKVKHQLAEELLFSGILSDEKLITTLLLPTIYSRQAGSHEFIAIVLSNVGFITPEIPYDIDIVMTLVKAIQVSGYSNPVHYRSVLSNLAFFGNSEVLEIMAEEFPLPKKLYQNVQRKIDQYKNMHYPEKLENYKKTYIFLIEKELRSFLEKIMFEISEHPFKLNGGGDTSIPEIDHPISKQAAKAYKIAKAAMNEDSLIDKFDETAQTIIQKLSSFGKKSWYADWGKRDASTTSLYTRIINKITEGKILIRHANECIQGARLAK